MVNEILKQSANHMLQASSVNELINAIIEFKFGEFLKHARILRMSRDAEVELIKQNLLQKTSKIDEENLINPLKTEQETVVMNSFDILKNSLGVEHYRTLFENLISSTFDKSKYSIIHPSFPFIIQQLTPLDARILLDIYDHEENSFTVGFSFGFINEDTSFKENFNDLYILNDETEKLEDFNLTNISINNLVKQGLIKLIPFDVSSDRESFDESSKKLKSINLFDVAKEHFSKNETLTQCGAATGPSSKIILTQLGKSFIKVCVE